MSGRSATTASWTTFFAVQDEITQAVTIAIVPAIAGAEQQRAMRKLPGSLDAWAAYQRGLWHLSKAAPVDNRLAVILSARNRFGYKLRRRVLGAVGSNDRGYRVPGDNR